MAIVETTSGYPTIGMEFLIEKMRGLFNNEPFQFFENLSKDESVVNRTKEALIPEESDDLFYVDSNVHALDAFFSIFSDSSAIFTYLNKNSNGEFDSFGSEVSGLSSFYENINEYKEGEDESGMTILNIDLTNTSIDKFLEPDDLNTYPNLFLNITGVVDINEVISALNGLDNVTAVIDTNSLNDSAKYVDLSVVYSKNEALRASVENLRFPGALDWQTKFVGNDAISQGLNNLGEGNYREILAASMSDGIPTPFHSGEKVIGHSSSELLHNLILANEGGVHTFDPTYIGYRDIANSTGRKISSSPINIKEGEQYIDLEILTEAIKNDVKLVILTNPGNPVNLPYNADNLSAVMRLLLGKGITVVCDEILGKLDYPENISYQVMNILDDNGNDDILEKLDLWVLSDTSKAISSQYFPKAALATHVGEVNKLKQKFNDLNKLFNPEDESDIFYWLLAKIHTDPQFPSYLAKVRGITERNISTVTNFLVEEGWEVISEGTYILVKPPIDSGDSGLFLGNNGIPGTPIEEFMIGETIPVEFQGSFRIACNKPKEVFKNLGK